jgi:hypothetical protein
MEQAKSATNLDDKVRHLTGSIGALLFHIQHLRNETEHSEFSRRTGNVPNL